MGGAEEVLRKAREAFERGEYRWVAMVLNHLVFAEPDDAEARSSSPAPTTSSATSLESGPWRDVYLTGAHELRNGVEQAGNRAGGGGGSAASDADGALLRLDGRASRWPQGAGKGNDHQLHLHRPG